MITLFFTAVMVALLGAFLIMLFKKLGFIEYLQIYGNRTFSELASCDFCLSFWITCVLSVLLGLIFWNWAFCLIVFFATPVTRKLL